MRMGFKRDKKYISVRHIMVTGADPISVDTVIDPSEYPIRRVRRWYDRRSLMDFDQYERRFGKEKLDLVIGGKVKASPVVKEEVVKPEPKPEPVISSDGDKSVVSVEHDAGPYFNVVVDGEIYERVKGRKAAQVIADELNG